MFLGTVAPRPAVCADRLRHLGKLKLRAQDDSVRHIGSTQISLGEIGSAHIRTKQIGVCQISVVAGSGFQFTEKEVRT